jgi:hypothetical protein
LFLSEHEKALRHGAKAKYTFKIDDEKGKSVSNATLHVGFELFIQQLGKVVGSTDTNGLFTAEGMTQWEVRCNVTKNGYYTSFWKIFLGRDGQEVSSGRWQPWNPTIPIVLREKRNPIPMFVKRFEGRFRNGEMVGFDCEKGDFVEPHGKGKVTDFIIHVNGSGIKYEDMTKRINLDSPDPDGGFIILKWYQHSAFKSEYLAPESGYAANLTADSSDDRTKKVNEVVLYHGGNLTRLDSGGEYLVFKSRIKRDDEGKIISANYGKIYGEFELMGWEKTKEARVRFTYYFNPTPNDRNIEFDGENSLLLKGAKFFP